MVFVATIVYGMLVISSPAAHATSSEPNAELNLLGIFDGNNNNPAGLETVADAIGLADGEDLRDYIIGETGSAGGADNGFMVDTFGNEEATAGEWWFDPTASGFDRIDYLVIKASNHYALYQVIYAEDVVAGETVMGTWAVGDLGKHAMSHITAYGDLSPVPVPATGLLFGSALLGLLGWRRNHQQ